MRNILLIILFLVSGFLYANQSENIGKYELSIHVLGPTPDFGLAGSYFLSTHASMDLGIGTRSLSTGINYQERFAPTSQWSASLGLYGTIDLHGNYIYLPVGVAFIFPSVKIGINVGPKYTEDLKFWGGLKISWRIWQ